MARPEPQRERDDVGDETSEDSFPASDPPRYRSQAVGGPSLDADALPPGAPAGLTYRDDFITPDEERAPAAPHRSCRPLRRALSEKLSDEQLRERYNNRQEQAKFNARTRWGLLAGRDQRPSL